MASPSSPLSLPTGEAFDLAVLGGGVVGLACAFEEAARGRRVAVLDPNALGSKASWAAAGILAARAGVVAGSPFRDLYLRSLAAYPGWLRRVEEISGTSVPFVRGGDFQVFPLEDPEARRALRARESQLQREKAVDFTVLEGWPDFLAPHASRQAVRIFHFPGEAHVDVRRLLTSLQAALQALGASLFPHCLPMAIQPGSPSLLRGQDWSLRAGQILIAGGAWSNAPLGLLGWSAPMTPVKGQLALMPDFHGREAMVHGLERFYLVPRGGNLVAGATTEPGVWDEDFDAVGDSYLRSELERFFPGKKPRWLETWSGLRPRTRDRLPLMGWVDEKAGIALCAGHYKSGISLAPLSARSLSDLLGGRKPPLDLKPFDPFRAGALRRA